VHRATEGITTRTIASWSTAHWSSSAPGRPLPLELVTTEGIEPFDIAIRAIHFPASQEELRAAEERLKFDELFTLELGVAFRKHRVEAAEQGVSHQPTARWWSA